MAPKPALPTPPKPPAFPSGIKPSTLLVKLLQQLPLRQIKVLVKELALSLTPLKQKQKLLQELKTMVMEHIPFTTAMALLELVEKKLPLVVVWTQRFSIKWM